MVRFNVYEFYAGILYMSTKKIQDLSSNCFLLEVAIEILVTMQVQHIIVHKSKVNMPNPSALLKMQILHVCTLL